MDEACTRVGQELAGKRRGVAVCERQVVAIYGLRTILAETSDLVLANAASSLEATTELFQSPPPDIFVIDKSFGIQAITVFVETLRLAHRQEAIAVWGVGFSEPEVLQLLRAGVRGILQKSNSISALLSCLRAVLSGVNWIDDKLFRSVAPPERQLINHYTVREKQVLALAELGLKNREIALHLGIRPGTVKIHLRHIFEKSGIQDRHGLILASLASSGSDGTVN